MSVSNVAALDETLAELRRMGRLEPVDEAMVEAARSIADELDDDPSNAQMWRQYRDTLDRLVADDSDGGGADELLAELSAEVRNTPKG